MVLACSTVSFPGDLAGALAGVARLGFTHADLVAIPFYRQLLPAEMAADPGGRARTIAEPLAALGLKAATFNAAVGDLHNREPVAVTQRLREWRGLAEIMARLDIRIASFYPGYLKQGTPWKAAMDRVAASAREMLSIAKKGGVEFVLEAHYDTPVATPEQIRALMKAVPGLRFVYDPSHFAMQGLAPAATDFLLERTAHVHVRDAAPGRMSVMGGTGTVDFARLLAALRERKYAGFVAVECLPPESGDAEADILAVRKLVEAGVQ
ncbi:MAG: sugar phosphate isomerase/epimerase [Candidatus Coatesbacteria bacterium]